MWLTNFYNSILTYGKVPKYLSTSTIIPLVKSYKKSLNNPDNYRGISILPTFTKLLEYLILHLCPSIIDSHSHQFGFKKNSSTLHAEFLLSETIKHYSNNSTPLYMCSLDANKAFDTCNWDLLFEKLYFQKKLPLSVVHTISSLYLSGTANVSYQGITSNQFSLSQGVRQGSILSPHLYSIYTENILNEIVSECKVGSTINGIYTGVIAYADDVILLSPTISGLQEVIDRFQTYGISNFIKLNTEKTEFLISGKSSIPNNVVQINGSYIYLQNKLKHLGFQWNNGNNNKKIATLQKTNLNERITQFQSVAIALIDSGIRYCQPSTIIHLYNTLAVPKLIYGLELCNFEISFLRNIDAVGRAVLKSFFCISKYSKNYLHSFFKIEDISTILIRNKINLFIRLLKNQTCYSLIINQLQTTQNKKSFTNEVIYICKTLGLNFFQYMIEGKQIKFTLPQEELHADIIAILKDSFRLWNLKEQRETFKTLMEVNIPKIELTV